MIIRSGYLLLVLLISMQVSAQELMFEQASEPLYAHPHDLVVSLDKQWLYVADVNNDRIAVLNALTLKLDHVIAQDVVSGPHDVAFDLNGNFLVADTNNDRIAIFKRSNKSAEYFASMEDGLSRPEGVVAHPNGQIYATGAGSDNVVSYRDGKLHKQIGGFSSPHDIEIAPDGSLWVADAANDRLVNISQSLEIIRSVSGAPYDFNGPRYLDFDQHGNMYVADKYSDSIKILGPDLKLKRTIGGSHATFGPGHFYHPEGVEIEGESIWFSDTYNNRIVRYQIVPE